MVLQKAMKVSMIDQDGMSNIILDMLQDACWSIMVLTKLIIGLCVLDDLHPLSTTATYQARSCCTHWIGYL
jgi:hypothetical protein